MKTLIKAIIYGLALVGALSLWDLAMKVERNQRLIVDLMAESRPLVKVTGHSAVVMTTDKDLIVMDGEKGK